MGLTLLRHTRPEIDEGICYGRSDLGLPAGAEAEMAAALDGLRDAPDAIVTSPAERCRQLAELAGQRFGLRVRQIPDLWEMDFGRWEGIAWAEIPRAELDAWAADFQHAQPHGGESVAEMAARVEGALAALRGGGPTLVVCHAGVQKVAAAMMGRAEAWTLSIPYGQWIAMPDDG
ncbi:MAG: alpha-ribazole phosphatase family protein [Pseudomonadota bacterium]